jgi:8-oxo-dGTP pyrophosphatase MutT (NUDIX family)
MKQRAAVVVFYTNDRRVLMHRRHDSDNQETWLFVGGKIKDGEDSETAAKREIREELGFDLQKYIFFRSYPRDEWSGGVEVFVSEFPGMDAFQETIEGDKRPELELLSFDEAIKKSMIPVAKSILKDLKVDLNVL